MRNILRLGKQKGLKSFKEFNLKVELPHYLLLILGEEIYKTIII